WRNGEPGIIFLDRINRDNPTPELGAIESTNPCGEQPLLPFESCNLGSINLSKFVKIENGTPKFDYDRLKDTVHLAVRFLDDVIDVNKYPLELIEETTKGNRKIGLGVMGFADTLIQLGIPYNSEKGVKTGRQIMKFIKEESVKASQKLAKERGTFPNYDKSIFADSGIKLRNATLTTIAPTGTISIIADASSGIEPLFAICYYRNVMDNDKLVEVNSYFLKVAKERGFYSKELIEKIAKEGSLQHIDEVPDDVKKVFVTAHDISPEWHIKMQAAFQKYVDNAVSKTVNFPNSATPEDIEKAYLLAYRLGCKGVTVYRDGSRDSQVLSFGDGKKKGQTLTPRPRPRMTAGLTIKNKIGCGNLYVTVNSDENGICEVFTNTGRAGGCPSQSEATSRLISLALRSNISINEITEQLKGIRCLSCIKNDNRELNGGKKILSCPDAIAWAIEQYIDNYSNNGTDKTNGNGNSQSKKEEIKLFNDAVIISGNDETSVNIVPCPDCGSSLEMESGCVVCRSCGFSKCH
ncbi:MAG: adenosylcobalamin-dependent ribonucleoside-diphosphate reductase, partial [Candidatus Schekmanbacteria bacterium]